LKSIAAIPAALAAASLVLSGPAFAAGGTRSSEALPLTALAGTVPYSKGIEERWRCVAVDNEQLGLDDDHVQVDAAGNVVLDQAGKPFRCRPPAAAAKSDGFPIEILLGILGAGGLIGALSGGKKDNGNSGGNDTPG